VCGIIGYAGRAPAAPILLRALKDLEYRGYDSAGIAVLEAAAGTAAFRVEKRKGKISSLESALGNGLPIRGTTGIGHTRWATHGRPNDRNAHPHLSCDGRVVVIHNGIVENYAALRGALREAGHRFRSDTDTETIAHLLEDEVRAGATLLDALRVVSTRLEGSQAIMAMSASEPGVIAAARLGNAGGIVVGYGDGEVFMASDLAAVIPHTRRVAFLADRQFARTDGVAVTFVDADGQPITPQVRQVPLDPVSALRGEYAHFMLKEIMEQPVALADTVHSLVTFDPPELYLDDLGAAAARLVGVRRVVLLGMGTSLHAAMIARRYFEELAGVPAEADNASEFRYRSPVLDGTTLVVSVSQSGETVDVLEAMAVARAAGALQVTVCNTEGAQTTRIADGTVYTRAGLERGVASTKCFVTAVAALYALALRLGQARGHLDETTLRARIVDLVHLPDVVARSLAAMPRYQRLAVDLADRSHMLFLGRGLAFPVAMEGALKMKEVSYIHAEGYAAGEMKHGPIALIDRSFQTIAVATRHALRQKMISNIEQVQARGGPVVVVMTEGDDDVPVAPDQRILVPEVAPLLEPIVATVPLQCLAYHVAVHRGCDVDQPRNLAKTVTVE
jgi:glucosamine--fructose-6-phosphate aminotransferase (isomerizing)